MGEKAGDRVLEVRGTMAKLRKENVVFTEVTWSLSAQKRRKIELFETMCLRNMCGTTRVGRVRNSLISGRCGCELSVLKRTERNVLKLLRHLEKMGQERLGKRVYRASVDGNRGRGRETAEKMEILSVRVADGKRVE